MSGLAFTSSHASLILCIIVGRQRVAALGPVHGEHDHVPVALDEQVLVGGRLVAGRLAHGLVSRTTHMAKNCAAPP